MTQPILQKSLPFAPWLQPATRRLPGTHPIAPEDWITRDDAFAPQMALRDHLIANDQDLVHALMPEAKSAAIECLDLMATALVADDAYQVGPEAITRPDGVKVLLDRTRPLLTIGRMTQSDVCILTPSDNGHRLTGAILCFPAHWTLSEKMGRPMGAIHGPVDSYDETMNRRVQRLFDALRPGQVLTRANAHLHKNPHLFAPRSESEPGLGYPRPDARYLRSERQTLRKLPGTNAVVFMIHTYMVALTDLFPEQLGTMDAAGLKRGLEQRP